MARKFLDGLAEYSDPASSGLKVMDGGGAWEPPDAGRKACDATGEWTAPELKVAHHVTIDDVTLDQRKHLTVALSGDKQDFYEGETVTIQASNSSAYGSDCAFWAPTSETVDENITYDQIKDRIITHINGEHEIGTFEMPDEDITIYAYCTGGMHVI